MEYCGSTIRSTILLVEDNEINQEVATELLLGAGMTVDVAANGLVATAMVRQRRYDLVLMDLHMPVMDGFEATRQIRTLFSPQVLPIIAMTASTSQEDRDRCRAAGMNDHLAKPIDTDELLAKVRMAIGHAHGTKRDPAQPGDEIDWLALLDGVADLDAAAGLRRALGRPTLYRRLLIKFVELESGFPARVAEAIAAADRQTVEREAHTMKGVAAQIGADRLADLAGDLVDAVRQGASPESLASFNARLSESLMPLVERLARSISTPAVARVPQSADRGALVSVCRRLSEALAQNDFVSNRLFSEGQEIMRSAFGMATDSLAEEINNCDYVAALRRLRQMMLAHQVVG